MIIESNGSKFFMTNRLYGEMQKFTVERLKKKDNNKIFLVCGDTGVGKSAFTFQLGAVCDKNFSLKNICFTTEQTKEGLRALRNQVVIFDEAFRGASGRNTLSKSQKELLQMLYEIRQLNQLVFLVAPSFFRLDEAIAVELADVLFYVYKLKNGRRAFRVFNKKKKDLLYYRARKTRKSYAIVKTLFNGLFPKTYVVPEEEYREKKFDSLYNKPNEGKEGIRDKERTRKEAVALATIIKLTGSYRKAVEHMEKYGGGLKRSVIQDKIAHFPEIHALVRPKQ